MTRRVLAALALGLLAACAHEEVRQDFAVGAHRVSIAMPSGWQLVDQGGRRLLRRGDLQLVLEDLGPLDRRGIEREIERVRALWRRGEDREARSAMAMIPVAPELFATPEQARAFWETWSDLAHAEGLAAADAEPRFDRLLDAVAGLKTRSDAQVVDAALAAMGEDRRRAVASSERRGSGRQSPFLVMTWNRLSHDDRRPFAVWIDDGRPLALRIERVAQPEAERAFESVARSLRIETVAPVDSAGARRSST
jgi:hypothetical protein